MKKKLGFLGLTFVSVFSLGFNTYASTTEVVEEAEVEELVDAGLTPDDALYGFDKFFENIAVRFTFSTEKKVEKLSQIAEERLAELNELDEEKAAIYADELFNEYGLNLEKANLFVQELVSEGKLSEEKLAKLEAKVQKTEEKLAKVNEKAKEKISEDVKEKVNQAIKDAKMSIFNKFSDQDAISALHDEGYGYGELLKLQAIAEISDKTIDELLQTPDVVTTNEENEKVVQFDVLLESLGLTQDDLKAKLVEYKETAKETMKKKIEEVKQEAVERRESVKEKVNENKEKANENKEDKKNK